MITTAERTAITMERSDHWLQEIFTSIWRTYFPDVPKVNNVDIRFYRRWKSRLGMIRLCDDGTTFIGLNQALRNFRVPDSITIVTIAHEIVHYSHGFGSPLPRKYSRPHQDDIVNKELELRGLGEKLVVFDKWINEEWYPFFFSLQCGYLYEQPWVGDAAS